MSLNFVDTYLRLKKTVDELNAGYARAGAEKKKLDPDEQAELKAVDEKYAQRKSEYGNAAAYLDGYIAQALGRLDASAENALPDTFASRQHSRQELQNMLAAMGGFGAGRDASGERKAALDLYRAANEQKTFLKNEYGVSAASETDEKEAVRRKYAALRQDIDSGLASCNAGYSRLTESDEVRAFATEAAQLYRAFPDSRTNTPFTLKIPSENAERFPVGYLYPVLPVASAFAGRLEKTCGYFNSRQSMLITPLTVTADGMKDGNYLSDVMLFLCDDDTVKNIAPGFTYIIANILRAYVPLVHRVTYIDFDSFNPQFLGEYETFTGKEALIDFAADREDAEKRLVMLKDSVENEPENARNRRYLLVRGNPDSACLEKIRQICVSSCKYNVTVIWAKRNGRNAEELASTLGAKYVFTSVNRWFALRTEGTWVYFALPAAQTQVSPAAREAIAGAYKTPEIRNDFSIFYDMKSLPGYLSRPKGHRDLTVRYGIEQKTKQPAVLKFEGLGFATYLLGMSGSGKSTLISDVVMSIIMNYHPDEVELWLADFKGAGFRPYITHCPPHIRCIVLSEEAEMVKSFVDRLYEELMRRRHLMNCDLHDHDITKYMPVIFVIIDEFSFMSDILCEFDGYRQKLHALLQQGRSLGFRFIFASQTYTSGVRALDDQAKKQIETRIIMKAASDDKKECLAIPSSQMTESMRVAIDTVKPHYTLTKRQNKDGTVYLEEALPYYLPEDDYKERYAYFAALSRHLRPVAEKDYSASDPGTYVCKAPVFVDREYSAFCAGTVKKEMAQQRADNPGLITDSDFQAVFGKVCSLTGTFYPVISRSARQNILVHAGNSEMAQAASVLLSALKGFEMQNIPVEIWADDNSRIFRAYEKQFRRFTVRRGIEEIRSALDADFRALRRDSPDRVVLLLGMEYICPDLNSDDEDDILAYRENTAKRSRRTDSVRSISVSLSMATAKTPEEEAEGERVTAEGADVFSLFMEYCEKTGTEMTEENMNEFYDRQRQGPSEKQGDAGTAAPADAERTPEPLPEEGKPDYQEIFIRFVRNAGRYGCHFMCFISNFQDLRKLGVKIEEFNHRITFRTDTADTSVSIIGDSSAFRISSNMHSFIYRAFGASFGNCLNTPFLHEGLTWDGWSIDSSGRAVSIRN